MAPLLEEFDGVFDLPSMDLGSATNLTDTSRLLPSLQSALGETRDWPAVLTWLQEQSQRVSEDAVTAQRAYRLLEDALAGSLDPPDAGCVRAAIEGLAGSLRISSNRANAVLCARWQFLARPMHSRAMALCRLDATLRTIDQQLRRIIDRCVVLRLLVKSRVSEGGDIGDREREVSGRLGAEERLFARMYYPCYYQPTPGLATVLDWELKNNRPFVSMSIEEFADLCQEKGIIGQAV